MGLREPQYLALSKLHALADDVDLEKGVLRDIQAACPPKFEFDTPFPSFCFGLATGVGKTRLMGAHMAWLHARYGWRDFFVLTPGDTIYAKTIRNFTHGDPKFVMDGTDLSDRITLVTGEDYKRAGLDDLLEDPTRINVYVFNVQKTYVSATRSLAFHGFEETFGGSFAEYLRDLDDLVVLMDESHRYRAPGSLEAITYLKPRLALEYTATPQSKNVLYDFPLGAAMGRFVKTPKLVARSGDDVLKGDLERAKLEDGFNRHEAKRTELEVVCKNKKMPVMLPLIFISTKDIAHAGEVAQLLRSSKFRGGKYADKVIEVHSKSEEQQIKDLVDLELPENQKEVVVHVNKLKEGWDVPNIWTIVPLRASVSEILTEQTIGRGLRLPFGTLINDPDYPDLDELEIISHEKYGAIIDKAEAFLKGMRVVESANRSHLVKTTVHADPARSKKLAIPRLSVSTSAKQNITSLGVKPTMEFEAGRRGAVQLVGTTIGQADAEVIGAAWRKRGASPRAAIAQAILDELVEVEAMDATKLGAMIERFLAALPPDARTDDVLERYGGAIVRNFIEEFRAKKKLNVVVEYGDKDGMVVFEDFEKAVPATDGVRETRMVTKDVKGILINGFKNSVFDANSFDSRPEKLLADALDRDKTVELWAKPPIDQAQIVWSGGSYNADFWVLMKNGKVQILEMKDDASVAKREPEVFTKARHARKWSEVASKAVGRPFGYALVPESAVNDKTATLAEVLDKAVPIDEPATTRAAKG